MNVKVSGLAVATVMFFFLENAYTQRPTLHPQVEEAIQLIEKMRTDFASINDEAAEVRENAKALVEMKTKNTDELIEMTERFEHFADVFKLRSQIGVSFMTAVLTAIDTYEIHKDEISDEGQKYFSEWINQRIAALPSREMIENNFAILKELADHLKRELFRLREAKKLIA